MVGRRHVLAGWMLGILASGAVATAATIPVGTGESRAEVYIEFESGAYYTFDVRFDGSPTGMDLLDIIEAQTSLSTVRVFGGLFLDGISYDGHSSTGFGGGENWWHYWTKEPGGEWFSPETYGASDRLVQDGSADGWIYGRAGAPLPEPATALLIAFGAAAAGLRRRGR